MSYNGSGTFQINTSGQPVVAGTVISSTAFNALTADLATGLSTAITKDGQTATTVRIPFAAGISSTLVTDSTSTSTGSIITAGGVGVAKALYVGTTANIAGVLSTTSPNITTSITTPSTSFDLINATATTLNLGGAATAVNVGAATGTMTVANTTLAAKAITASTTLSVTGVTTVQAGTAALPAITTTGDTNTGIFFPAADTIAFTEGGAEAARINSSGDFGIGTASPSARLHVDSGSTADGFRLNSTTTSVFNSWFLSSTRKAYFLVDSSGILIDSEAASTSQRFATQGSERMRIDSSGNVFVGATSGYGGVKFYIQGTAGASNANSIFGVASATAGDTTYPGVLFSKADNNSTTSQVFVRFSIAANTAASGQINANGVSAVAFGSWSDKRLKENITELPSQLANIMALRPVEFDYIESEGGGHQIGFIAQDVQEIYPDLVGERSDGMLTLTDLNKNDARLIKCIQEQQALITALTARITALENK